MPTYIKPNPDNQVEGKTAKVFDPVHNDFLPDNGRMVNLSPYWINRLRNNEVIRANPDDAPGTTVQEKLESEKQLDTMTKAQIVEFAKAKFNLDLDKGNNKNTLIQLVMSESELHDDDDNHDSESNPDKNNDDK